jgi:hypothetical protein
VGEAVPSDNEEALRSCYAGQVEVVEDYRKSHLEREEVLEDCWVDVVIAIL